MRVLFFLLLVLTNACFTRGYFSSSEVVTKGQDVGLIAADCVRYLKDKYPPAKTAIFFNSVYYISSGEEGLLSRALEKELRISGYAVNSSEEKVSGEIPLGFTFDKIKGKYYLKLVFGSKYQMTRIYELNSKKVFIPVKHTSIRL